MTALLILVGIVVYMLAVLALARYLGVSEDRRVR